MDKNVTVTGIGFNGRADILKSHCKEGESILLKRESKNKYDANAIAVYIEVPALLRKKLKHVGYIETSEAKILAKKMDEGMEILAKVRSFSVSSKNNYPRLNIALTDTEFSVS